MGLVMEKPAGKILRSSFVADFPRAYFTTSIATGPLKTRFHMHKIAALLLVTTAAAATSAAADSTPLPQDPQAPFIWTEIGDPKTESRRAPRPVRPEGMQDDTATRMPMPPAPTARPNMPRPTPPVATTDAPPATTAPDTPPTTARSPSPAPAERVSPRRAPPAPPQMADRPGQDAPAETGDSSNRNPMMRDYPSEDGPRHGAGPDGAGPRWYADDQCMDGVPYGFDGPPPGVRDEPLNDPRTARRGEMTGDDGVLETIQDDPCALMYRRGGETAASHHEYTHPEDIRRANVLEDRRIPLHSVGRYTGPDSGVWYRDPRTPFADAPQPWRVSRGLMLSQMLTAWGDAAGYNVVWRTSYDFIVETDVVIEGTFPEAAGRVIESFSNANPPLAAEFYPSNRVMVVHSATEFDGR